MVANGYIIQLSIVAAAAAAAEKLLVHRAAGCSVFFSSHPWLLGRGMKKKKSHKYPSPSYGKKSVIEKGFRF